MSQVKPIRCGFREAATGWVMVNLNAYSHDRHVKEQCFQSQFGIPDLKECSRIGGLERNTKLESWEMVAETIRNRLYSIV